MKRNPESKMRNGRSKSQGAAIMLALWALFLLAAMVISWALDIDSRFSLSAKANRRLEAVAMACSGAEVALVAKPGSPNLRGQFAGRRSYKASITGEGGRIDINYFAYQADRDPRFRKVLSDYLYQKGFDLIERDTMIDSLLDWVLPKTGLHRLNAPPESEDYHPPGQPLTEIDQLKKIKGWEEFASNPDWVRDFTVYTHVGVELKWASQDVLLALGISEPLVERFLDLRRGPDGKDGTEDDMQFKDQTELYQALGLSDPRQIQQLQGLTALNVPWYRIVSDGTSGKAQRTVELLVNKLSGGPVSQVIMWKEY